MRKRKPESTAAVAARVARFDERLQSAGGLLIRCTLRLREDELVAHYRALLARTQRGDLLWFYYAGHGELSESALETLRVLAVDPVIGGQAQDALDDVEIFITRERRRKRRR